MLAMNRARPQVAMMLPAGGWAAVVIAIQRARSHPAVCDEARTEMEKIGHYFEKAIPPEALEVRRILEMGWKIGL